MALIERRPSNRGRRQSSSLFLTNLARGVTNVTPGTTLKTLCKQTTLGDEHFWSDEEPDPPKKYPEPHDVKIKLYLRECEKLNVIPVSAYLRQPTKNALKLSHYNIGPNGARALSAALLVDTTMSYLDIEGNSITPIGLASIKEALTENICITNLNIADNKLGSQGAQLIGLMMVTNHCIVSFNASRNGFRDTDAEIFAKIIKENRILKELILSGNEFEEHAGTVIGNALASSETLERLDLSWNHIRKKGAEELAKGIKENVGLKKLNVSFNGFGLEGTAYMAQALTTNRSLLELDLSKNRITDIDVRLLSKQLAQNESLRILKLGDNLITALGAMDILKALIQSETSTLEEIDFGSTSVDQGFLIILKELQDIKSNISVTYGKVQNIYADRDMMPEPEKPPPEVADMADMEGEDLNEGEMMEMTEKGQTYVVDNGKEGGNGGAEKGDSGGRETVLEGEDKDDGDNEFNDKKLDDEVEAVTGKSEKVKEIKQEAIVMESESVGTITPDI